MTNRFGFVTSTGALVALGLMVFPASVVHADLGFWSQALVGTWRHPTNGDRYRFGSDATYTFTAGAAKARAGQLSHSGYWKIVQPTERESGGSMEGPVALSLRSRTRIVRRGGQKFVLDSRRLFRVVVDAAFKGDSHSIDKNHYYIERAKWVRVR